MKNLLLNKISILFAVILTCLLLEPTTAHARGGRWASAGVGGLVGARVGRSRAERDYAAYDSNYAQAKKSKKDRKRDQNQEDKIRDLQEENARLKKAN